MLAFLLFCLIYYTLLWLFDLHKPSENFRAPQQVKNNTRPKTLGAYPEDAIALAYDSPAPLHTAA